MTIAILDNRAQTLTVYDGFTVIRRVEGIHGTAQSAQELADTDWTITSNWHVERPGDRFHVDVAYAGPWDGGE